MPGEGTAVVGRQTPESPWREEVPVTRFWAHSTAKMVPAGHQEMAKKVNSILQYGKGFLFVLRPTCYLFYREKEQSMINSKVQSSRAPEFSPQPQYIHDTPSSQYSTSHTHTVQKSKKFSKKSTLKKA